MVPPAERRPASSPHLTTRKGGVLQHRRHAASSETEGSTRARTHSNSGDVGGHVVTWSHPLDTFVYADVVRVHESARKHGVADADMPAAVDDVRLAIAL